MKSKFIVSVVVIILIVIGLGVFMNKGSNKPGKYDAFVGALKEGGAQFYGAFWCPHCQAQEKELGMSRQKLESIGLYVECSNPDQTPTQACLDKKVESYPTWMFRDGISVPSESDPVVCQPKSDTPTPGEEKICEQIASKFYKTYLFPGYKFSIKSPTEPVKKDGVWKFEVNAQTQGEIPLEFLASQIGFTLPQE